MKNITLLLAIFVLKRKRRLGRKETVLARKKKERYDDEFDPTNILTYRKFLDTTLFVQKYSKKIPKRKKEKKRKKTTREGKKEKINKRSISSPEDVLSKRRG